MRIMDQETHESKAIVGSSGQIDKGLTESLRKDCNNLDNGIVLEKGICEPMGEGTSGNSSDLVNEIVLERMIVMNSGEIVSITAENKIDELRSNSKVIEQEEGTGNNEPLNKLEQESDQDSNISISRAVHETVIVVNSEENTSINQRNHRFEIKGQSKVKVDKSKTNVNRGEKQTCVIDVRGGFKDCDGESVCRICHLSSEGLAETTPTNSSMELIHLGCGCKDELGIAHVYCAEAWFKLKGNRKCEICGDMAKNITGVGDNRFMEEWNRRRFISSSSNSSDRGGGCLRGQPFCNLLMACLLSLLFSRGFFRVNML